MKSGSYSPRDEFICTAQKMPHAAANIASTQKTHVASSSPKLSAPPPTMSNSSAIALLWTIICAPPSSADESAKSTGSAASPMAGGLSVFIARASGK